MAILGIYLMYMILHGIMDVNEVAARLVPWLLKPFQKQHLEYAQYNLVAQKHLCDYNDITSIVETSCFLNI